MIVEVTHSRAELLSTLFYEAVVLGNQSIRDRPLIGRAIIIISERTGSSWVLNFELT